MKLPALPPTVRIVPVSCRDKNGNAEPDAPVFVVKPLSSMEVSGFAAGVSESAAMTYATIAVERLVGIESLQIGDESFDKANPAHIAALDPVWLWEVGSDLFGRAHFSDEELGKSPSPSD